jgi:general secretion pathway protein C
MTAFLSGKGRIINYLLFILILIVSLFLLRNIIRLLYIKNDSRITDIKDIQTKKREQEKRDIMSYSVILEKNPFGKPMKLYPLTAMDGTESNDVVSPSDLILVGTAVGPEDMKYAVFESKESREQEVFRYGDEVFNYGKLIAIEPQFVKIRQGGSVIAIEMIDINSNPARARLKVNNLQGSFVKKIGEKDYILDRDKVQHALENPEQILTDARLLPNFKDGKQQGFKIYEVKPGGIYESLGLRNGDILLKINGLDISSPEVAIQAMSALRGMNRINLDIMRRGSKLSLNYQIR